MSCTLATAIQALIQTLVDKCEECYCSDGCASMDIATVTDMCATGGELSGDGILTEIRRAALALQETCNLTTNVELPSYESSCITESYISALQAWIESLVCHKYVKYQSCDDQCLVAGVESEYIYQLDKGPVAIFSHYGLRAYYAKVLPEETSTVRTLGVEFIATTELTSCEDVANLGDAYCFETCCTTYTSNKVPLIILTASQYSSLGSPTCIVYDDCCYIYNTTVKNPSSMGLDVTASESETCEDCNTANPDCECESSPCTGCGADYLVTISGLDSFQAASHPTPTTCANFELDGQHTLHPVTAFPSLCVYRAVVGHYALWLWPDETEGWLFVISDTNSSLPSCVDEDDNDNPIAWGDGCSSVWIEFSSRGGTEWCPEEGEYEYLSCNHSTFATLCEEDDVCYENEGIVNASLVRVTVEQSTP